MANLFDVCSWGYSHGTRTPNLEEDGKRVRT